MANPVGTPITPGSGAIVAGHLVNEGSQDRILQRVVTNTAEGEDVSVGSTAQIDLMITRPANATPYTAEDVFSDSVSAPVATGYQFTGASRGSGKSGLITDLLVFGSVAPGTLLQAELWLFDSSVANLNDNAVFALNMTDLRKLVAVLPFTMKAAGGGTAYAEVTNVNKGFVTAGSPNLYGMVKVKNAYTPASGEQIVFRLKLLRTN